MKKISINLLLCSALIIYQQCAPVFSELQSARLVGKGNVDITPSYSTVNFAEDGESDGVQNHIGIQSSIGISEKVDLRLRFEHIWLKDENSYNEQVFGVGAKFSLVKDRIALYTPIGFAVSDVAETLEFQPTLLFTVPLVANQVDLNPSVKYIIPFCSGCEGLIAVNLGVGIGKDVTRTAFRAEYGLLYNPGESGRYGQFTVGFTHTFMKKKD